MCDAIFMVLSLSILGVFRGISINSVRNLERERKKKLWKIIQNFCRSIFKWKIHHFGRNVAFDRTQLKLTLEWFSIKNYLPVLFFSITNFFLRKQQQKLFFWGKKATAVAAKNSIKFHMLCLSLSLTLSTHRCVIFNYVFPPLVHARLMFFLMENCFPLLFLLTTHEIIIITMMKFFYFEMHTLLYALFDWSEFTSRGHGIIAKKIQLKLCVIF